MSNVNIIAEYNKLNEAERKHLSKIIPLDSSDEFIEGFIRATFSTAAFINKIDNKQLDLDKKLLYFCALLELHCYFLKEINKLSSKNEMIC